MNVPPTIQDHALETLSDDEGLSLEDRLWWVSGRKAIIQNYVQRAARLLPVSTIMDIGCGSGGNFDVLRRFGRVYGVEPSPTLARRAARRGLADGVFTRDAWTLKETGQVDLFSMFDVLEHIEDDQAFLENIKKAAPQKHALLISVPACPFMYSEHDRILHHYRRYSARQLKTVLENAGYRVEHVSYFMFFLFPLAYLARMKEKLWARLGRRTDSVEIGDFPSIIAAPFAALLRMEAFLSRGWRFPVGLWLFALAVASDDTETP